MHYVEVFAVGLAIGVGLGYAFRGRENYMIRLTVNEAISAWTKAQQMAGTLNQNVKSEASKIASKL